MRISELLSSEERWTKGYWARNSGGSRVYYDSSGAVCWCLKGACHKCLSSEYYFEATDRLKAVITKLFPTRIKEKEDVLVTFNDHKETTFEDVMKVLEEANL